MSDEIEYGYAPNEVPIRCPKCGSDDIFNDDPNWFTAEVETKKYGCNKCDFMWAEYWRFEDWEPTDLV